MKTRPGLRLWHRWFGLLGGLWLALLALTGSAIAFYDEIDRTLNPELRLVEPRTGDVLPVDDIVASAEQALPGFAPDNLLLAQEPDQAHWLLGRLSSGDEMMGVQVFVDPYDGRMLGWRESGVLKLDRQHVPDLLYGLHTEFLAGEAGAWLAGIVALAWLLDHFLALPLAIPRLSHWQSAFALKGSPGSLRRLFDWHRAKGMWAWGATFVLALTSVTLIFPVATRQMVDLVSPVSHRLHEDMPETGPPDVSIGIDRAMAIAAPAGEPVHSVRLFPWAGAYAVRTFDPAQDPDDQGRSWTYVDMADGTIMGTRHDNGTSAGDLFLAWQYPLHSGRFAGLPGRIIVALLGLLTMWLCWSGLRLYLSRKRKRFGSPDHG